MKQQETYFITLPESSGRLQRKSVLSKGDRLIEHLETNYSNDKPKATVKLPTRTRNFKLKVYSRKNMFEGFSFIQYDQYAIMDCTMQKVLIRDQLIILIDKASTLKNEVFDDSLTRKIVKFLRQDEIEVLNRRLEEVLSIMNELIKLLLFGMSADLPRHPRQVRST